MKRTHVAWSITLISLLSLFAGCKGRDTATGASGTASPAVTANANAPANSNKSAETPPASEPPKLIGTYEAREVEDKGVVTLITQIKTIFVFRDDGTYSRVSQVKGKTYHSDSGQFRIEGPDKLVLTIQIAEKNIKSPPVVKTQRFSLSPDGDELKLTSAKKGLTATYQRTAKPKAS
jgi:hypothetical protein